MSLVDKIDEELTNLAEGAVRKYNWVTGGNKLDLANNLTRISSLTLPTGYALTFGEDRPIFAGSLGLIWLAAFSFRIKTDTKNYEKEMSARENGCLDPFVEKSYSNSKKCGVVLGAIGITDYSFALDHFVSNNDPVRGTGSLITGCSLLLDPVHAYVMATQEEPPHKDNCLKRGWEKTKEVVRKYLTPEPALIPALAKGRRLSI